MSLQYFEHVIVICRSYSAKKHLHVILNRNVKTCLFGNRFWACNMLPKYTYTTLSYDTMATNSIPMISRKAKVIAVEKPGKDQSLAANYRPISLLSVCYKLV